MQTSPPPPPRVRYIKDNDGTRPETEAERGAGGGGSKTVPQLRSGREARGTVSGGAEGRILESHEADGEADISDGQGGRRGLRGRTDQPTRSR